jgi:hypothetical protein
MGHDEDQNAFVQRRPAKDVVLAQRPVLVQASLQVYEVTALTQGIPD